MLTKNGTHFSVAAILLAVLTAPAHGQNYGGNTPLQMITPYQQVQGMVMNPETDPNLHPVYPLLGRRFQNGANSQQPYNYNYNYGNNNYGGGTIASGNGYSYGTGQGYGNYGYGTNTLIVPSDNGGDYVVGGAAGGVTYAPNGYPLNYGSQGYTVPLTDPNATGPYVTTPSQGAYDNSGAYLPVPQQSVTNIYNTYNYYPATNAGNAVNPNAVAAPTASAGSVAPAASSAPVSQPTLPGATAGANALAPDDADLLAAAYADIQRGWIRGDVDLIKKHVDLTGSISILSKARFQYSVASDKFLSSTDSLFDQIITKSFTFTALQKQTNGDITAYATHVYSLRSADDSAPKKTIYVSYVMSKRPAGWVIVAVDSSQTPLTSSAADNGTALHYSNSN